MFFEKWCFVEAKHYFSRAQAPLELQKISKKAGLKNRFKFVCFFPFFFKKIYDFEVPNGPRGGCKEPSFSSLFLLWAQSSPGTLPRRPQDLIFIDFSTLFGYPGMCFRGKRALERARSAPDCVSHACPPALRFCAPLI